MDIVSTFLPIAEELIDQVFPTKITYIRSTGTGYDPSTGEVTQSTTQYPINAGVLSTSLVETGGVGETYELKLYIHQGPAGVPERPTTGDVIEYDSRQWKVTTVDPAYMSEGYIACLITARNQ